VVAQNDAKRRRVQKPEAGSRVGRPAHRIDFPRRGHTIHRHVHNIRMTVGGVELVGTLNSSPLTEKILKLLPFESVGESWGEEVYFPVELDAENHEPATEVKTGDIAYWPDGPDLCVFFGPTPKSTGDVPVPASPVTVLGTFQFGPGDFDRIERHRHGIHVRVEPGQ
jgi:hypothetical protein